MVWKYMSVCKYSDLSVECEDAHFLHENIAFSYSTYFNYVVLINSISILKKLSFYWKTAMILNKTSTLISS